MMSEPTSTWIGGLLGLYAQTPLHPGSGTALGSVDLPVQRERITQWPTVAGSAVKGILRDACRERISRESGLDDLPRSGDKPAEPKDSPRKRADSTMLLNQVFGPPAGGSTEFAGALSVTDARLLAFPVRSAKGVYAWVSCPAVLDRLARDAALSGFLLMWPACSIASNKAIVSSSGCACLVDANKLLLEEFSFEKIDGDCLPVAKWIADNLLPEQPAYGGTRSRFPRHFVILNDDDFTHFAKHATEIMARVGLNYDTKTVREGALFYQEFLPAESLFYSVVLANAARARSSSADATAVLKTMTDFLPPILQVGGDETTGKGYCATRFTLGPSNNGAERGGQS